MKVKKYLIVGALSFFLAGTAHAWSITETVEYYPGEVTCDDGGCWETADWTTVNFGITNDSSENMVGFGVGISQDLDPENIYSYASALGSTFWYSSPVGDWQAQIINDTNWDNAGFATDTGMTTYSAYFGATWDETFGDTYAYAYVAVPSFNPYTYSGFFAPGQSWEEAWGFFYEYSEWGIPYSPAIALFDSGISIGETDFNNPNPTNAAPVPEPATMLLFGTGLLGLVGYQKRKNKSKNVN